MGGEKRGGRGGKKEVGRGGWREVDFHNEHDAVSCRLRVCVCECELPRVRVRVYVYVNERAKFTSVCAHMHRKTLDS